MTEELEQVLTEVVLKHPLEQLVEWSKVYRDEGEVALQAVLRSLPSSAIRERSDMAHDHRFTKLVLDGVSRGLYAREIRVPAHHFVLTERHKTQHPYVVSAGTCFVWTPEDGIKCIQAPHTGITEPGTQRLVYVAEDTVWTTFHTIDDTDLDVIERKLIDKTGAFAPVEISAKETV